MVVTGVTGNLSVPSDTEGRAVKPPAEADIAWFNVQMQRSLPPPVQNEGQISPLSQASAASLKSSERADRDLQRAASSLDPQQILQANRSLSSFYLESLLSAKLVSKAVQSVEKLTSLQ